MTGITTPAHFKRQWPNVLRVERAGISCLQDLGRPRSSRFGLPTNGALDQFSSRVANVLVGNEETAALIEITATDFRCVTSTDTLIAVTGAPAATRVDDTSVPQWEPLSVAAGQLISISNIVCGLRVYVAVLGSLVCETLLGSCSPDPVIGFGHYLRDGDEIGTRRIQPVVDHPVYRHPLLRVGAPRPRFADTWTIDVLDGPDLKQFQDTDVLFRTSYTLSTHSNQVGLRLRGAVPTRAETTEMLSRGVPVGAVEVPGASSDELLILQRGRGVTAGYPVVAVVTTTGISEMGQIRPGQTVAFRRSTRLEAIASYRSQLSAIDALRTRVATAFNALQIPVCAAETTHSHVHHLGRRTHQEGRDL